MNYRVNARALALATIVELTKLVPARLQTPAESPFVN
jgi:hypothetical protein